MQVCKSLSSELQRLHSRTSLQPDSEKPVCINNGSGESPAYYPNCMLTNIIVKGYGQTNTARPYCYHFFANTVRDNSNWSTNTAASGIVWFANLFAQIFEMFDTFIKFLTTESDYSNCRIEYQFNQKLYNRSQEYKSHIVSLCVTKLNKNQGSQLQSFPL